MTRRLARKGAACTSPAVHQRTDPPPGTRTRRPAVHPHQPTREHHRSRRGIPARSTHRDHRRPPRPQHRPARRYWHPRRTASRVRVGPRPATVPARGTRPQRPPTQPRAGPAADEHTRPFTHPSPYADHHIWRRNTTDPAVTALIDIVRDLRDTGTFLPPHLPHPPLSQGPVAGRSCPPRLRPFGSGASRLRRGNGKQHHLPCPFSQGCRTLSCSNLLRLDGRSWRSPCRSHPPSSAKN
jgi:hypothetical protein